MAAMLGDSGIQKWNREIAKGRETQLKPKVGLCVVFLNLVSGDSWINSVAG